jgi:drug/metabolite transporter (DMT)-like permease
MADAVEARRSPATPADDRSLYAYGVALIFVAAVAFSLGGVFMRSISTEVWNVLFWRGVISSALLFLFLLARERRGVFRSFHAVGWPGLLMACTSAAAMTCFLTSVSLTTVANNSIIYATAPFMSAGLALVFTGERPGRTTLVAAALALSGVVLTVAGATGRGDLRGDLLAVGMAFFGSISPVIIRRYRDIPMLPASCLSALFVGLVAIVLSSVMGTPASPFTVGERDMVLLFLFSLCQQCLGHLTYTVGARYIPPGHTSLIFTLEAVLGPLWVWIVFAENPGQAAILGGLIVIAAVVGHVLITTGLSKRWRD